MSGCFVLALFGLGLFAAPSIAHEPEGPSDGRARSRFASAAAPSVARAAQHPHDHGTRSVQGEIVILQDDGTMIANGVFVPTRAAPALFTVLPDSFDLVNVFGSSAFADSMFPSASEYLVRNHVAGLGMSADLNRNTVIGIRTHRLKSIQWMNDVRHFGPTPTAPVPRFGVLDFTGVELLGSEVVHAHGCYLRIDQVLNGADLLGRLNAHWSFYLDSGASVMEGCRWQDNGDGTFTTIEALNEISELDEYVMGLRAAADVAPMFLLRNASPPPPGGAGDATFPFPGFTTAASRLDFTIQDVIAQNGPRAPDAAAAPHHFTMAFVLVVPEGEPAPAADLAFLEQFRADWEAWFSAETEGVGTMTTTIPRVPVQAAFEVDRFMGPPPLDVSFTARPSGTVSWLYWDFGDGSPLSDEIRPEHTYETPGTYTAKLTVMGLGGPAVATRTIRVGPTVTLAEHTFEGSAQGWAAAPPNTAPAGKWEWADPQGTMTFGVYVQPEDDRTPAGTHCWVTDADAGSFPAQWDVDAGVTTIVSPIFDLAAAPEAHVSYARWYTNSLAGFSEEDVMTVDVSVNGGASWINLETVGTSDTKWIDVQFRIADFAAPTAATRFRVQASDFGGQSLVEAAFDDFRILAPDPAAVGAGGSEIAAAGGAARLTLSALPNHPNPFSGSTVLRYQLPRAEPVTVRVVDSRGRAVRTLEQGVRAAGPREIAWDGRDAEGRMAAAGVYVVRIETAEGAVSRKIQLVR